MSIRSFVPVLSLLLIVPALAAQKTDTSANLEQHVSFLASDSLAGRGFGFPEKAMAVDYIIRQFENAGFRPFNGSYIQSFRQIMGLVLVDGKNIIGIIEGTDPVLRDEYILIGAHYDHLGWRNGKDNAKIIYNGADDNASGVASIIEAGKLLAENRNELKRSVIIAAFDGEEAGLIGSYAFLGAKNPDPSRIKAMFSLDMVGMMNKHKGINLDGFNSIKEGEKSAKRIAAEAGVDIVSAHDKIEMRTDTWPFGKKDIPAIAVTTGEESPYHKPEDDSNLLDYSGMSDIVNMMVSMVRWLSSDVELEKNSRFINHAVDPHFMLGYGMDIGNNHQLYRDKFYDSKSVFSFGTGISAHVKIARYFAFQPGVSYEMNGGRDESGVYHLHCLNANARILLTTPIRDISRPFGFVSCGFYHRYNFAGTRDGSKFDFTGTYFRNENGLCVGTGLQAFKFQISIEKRMGLEKITSEAPDGKIFNRTTYVSLIRYF